MNAHLRFSGLVLLALGTACAGVPATNPAPASPALAAEPAGFPADTEIRAMLAEIVPDPQVHGMVVGLLEPNGSRRVIAYGSAGPGGPPLDSESVLEIGSITKAFTGVLLADMARRGEVELTEPLARLLPPPVRVPSRNGKQITLLDLATHTSGLPPMPGNFPQGDAARAYAGYTMEQMYEFLSGYSLPRDPGEKFEYSNLSTILGHALALRAGKPYEALLHERVLAPLKMEQTAATFTPDMERRMTRGTNGFGDPQPYFVAPAFIASGSLKSTMNDMLRFAAANLSRADTGLYAALRDSRRPRRPIDEAGDSMGLGWGAANGVAGLNGGTFGYNSSLFVDPERRRAIVVMTNIAGGDGTALRIHLMDPAKFPRPKPSVGRAVASVYRAAGLQPAIQRYHTLRETAPEGWRFDEQELNSVGYWLLGRKIIEDAIAIFRLNVEMYPEAPNPHDSLGDAYLAAGRLQDAITSYRGAVTLAEAANHPNLAGYRASLARAIQQLNQPR